MPSLLRFLFLLAVCASLLYGAMLAIVTFGKVTPHEISEPVTLKANGA